MRLSIKISGFLCAVLFLGTSAILAAVICDIPTTLEQAMARSTLANEFIDQQEEGGSKIFGRGTPAHIILVRATTVDENGQPKGVVRAFLRTAAQDGARLGTELRPDGSVKNIIVEGTDLLTGERVRLDSRAVGDIKTLPVQGVTARALHSSLTEDFGLRGTREEAQETVRAAEHLYEQIATRMSEEGAVAKAEPTAPRDKPAASSGEVFPRVSRAPVATTKPSVTPQSVKVPDKATPRPEAPKPGAPKIASLAQMKGKKFTAVTDEYPMLIDTPRGRALQETLKKRFERSPFFHTRKGEILIKEPGQEKRRRWGVMTGRGFVADQENNIFYHYTSKTGEHLYVALGALSRVDGNSLTFSLKDEPHRLISIYYDDSSKRLGANLGADAEYSDTEARFSVTRAAAPRMATAQQAKIQEPADVAFMRGEELPAGGAQQRFRGLGGEAEKAGGAQIRPVDYAERKQRIVNRAQNQGIALIVKEGAVPEEGWGVTIRHPDGRLEIIISEAVAKDPATATEALEILYEEAQHSRAALKGIPVLAADELRVKQRRLRLEERITGRRASTSLYQTTQKYAQAAYGPSARVLGLDGVGDRRFFAEGAGRGLVDERVRSEEARLGRRLTDPERETFVSRLIETEFLSPAQRGRIVTNGRPQPFVERIREERGVALLKPQAPRVSPEAEDIRPVPRVSERTDQGVIHYGVPPERAPPPDVYFPEKELIAYFNMGEESREKLTRVDEKSGKRVPFFGEELTREKFTQLDPTVNYLYAVDLQGRVYVAKETEKSLIAGRVIHPSLVGGEPVRAAGMLQVVRTADGKTYLVFNNDSGYYKPPASAEFVNEAKTAFNRAGLALDEVVGVHRDATLEEAQAAFRGIGVPPDVISQFHIRLSRRSDVTAVQRGPTLPDEAAERLRAKYRGRISPTEGYKLGSGISRKATETELIPYPVIYPAKNVEIFLSRRTAAQPYTASPIGKVLDQRGFAELRPGKYSFVVDPSGRLLFSQDILSGHAALTNGEPVRAAGTFKVVRDAGGNIILKEYDNAAPDYNLPPKTLDEARLAFERINLNIQGSQRIEKPQRARPDNEQFVRRLTPSFGYVRGSATKNGRPVALADLEFSVREGAEIASVREAAPEDRAFMSKEELPSFESREPEFISEEEIGMTSQSGEPDLATTRTRDLAKAQTRETPPRPEIQEEARERREPQTGAPSPRFVPMSKTEDLDHFVGRGITALPNRVVFDYLAKGYHLYVEQDSAAGTVTYHLYRSPGFMERLFRGGGPDYVRIEDGAQKFTPQLLYLMTGDIPQEYRAAGLRPGGIKGVFALQRQKGAVYELKDDENKLAVQSQIEAKIRAGYRVVPIPGGKNNEFRLVKYDRNGKVVAFDFVIDQTAEKFLFNKANQLFTQFSARNKDLIERPGLNLVLARELDHREMTELEQGKTLFTRTEEDEEEVRIKEYVLKKGDRHIVVLQGPGVADVDALLARVGTVKKKPAATTSEPKRSPEERAAVELFELKQEEMTFPSREKKLNADLAKANMEITELSKAKIVSDEVRQRRFDAEGRSQEIRNEIKELKSAMAENQLAMKELRARFSGLEKKMRARDIRLAAQRAAEAQPSEAARPTVTVAPKVAPPEAAAVMTPRERLKRLMGLIYDIGEGTLKRPFRMKDGTLVEGKPLSARSVLGADRSAQGLAGIVEIRGKGTYEYKYDLSRDEWVVGKPTAGATESGRLRESINVARRSELSRKVNDLEMMVKETENQLARVNNPEPNDLPEVELRALVAKYRSDLAKFRDELAGIPAPAADTRVREEERAVAEEARQLEEAALAVADEEAKAALVRRAQTRLPQPVGRVEELKNLAQAHREKAKELNNEVVAHRKIAAILREQAQRAIAQGDREVATKLKQRVAEVEQKIADFEERASKEISAANLYERVRIRVAQGEIALHAPAAPAMGAETPRLARREGAFKETEIMPPPSKNVPIGDRPKMAVTKESDTPPPPESPRLRQAGDPHRVLDPLPIGGESLEEARRAVAPVRLPSGFVPPRRPGESRTYTMGERIGSQTAPDGSQKPLRVGDELRTGVRLGDVVTVKIGGKDVDFIAAGRDGDDVILITSDLTLARRLLPGAVAKVDFTVKSVTEQGGFVLTRPTEGALLKATLAGAVGKPDESGRLRAVAYVRASDVDGEREKRRAQLRAQAAEREGETPSSHQLREYLRDENLVARGGQIDRDFDEQVPAQLKTQNANEFADKAQELLFGRKPLQKQDIEAIFEIHGLRDKDGRINRSKLQKYLTEELRYTPEKAREIMGNPQRAAVIVHYAEQYRRGLVEWAALEVALGLNLKNLDAPMIKRYEQLAAQGFKVRSEKPEDFAKLEEAARRAGRSEDDIAVLRAAYQELTEQIAFSKIMARIGRLPKTSLEATRLAGELSALMRAGKITAQELLIVKKALEAVGSQRINIQAKVRQAYERVRQLAGTDQTLHGLVNDALVTNKIREVCGCP